MDDEIFKERVKVSPIQLNKGEKDFVDDLKQYYQSNQKYFSNKKVYLLRNQSRTGIGFLTETKNFYPDFILWQVVGEKQYISFIDPKGIYMIKDIWNHPKVKLWKTIKSEFQIKLEDKNTFLNSFIISNTPYRVLRISYTNNDTINMYHSYNIYFQEEDKNTYIESVLKRGLIENY